MFTPAATSDTLACTWSGVAWPSSCTASRTSCRCAVSRSPRARSTLASDASDTPRAYSCCWRSLRSRGRAGPGRGWSGWGSLARVPDRVVAVLGRGVVPAETPILRADDLGALRGDGIFETMHVRAGRPWLVDEHLTRMARSAARLELPMTARPAMAELVVQA